MSINKLTSFRLGYAGLFYQFLQAMLLLQ